MYVPLLFFFPRYSPPTNTSDSKKLEQEKLKKPVVVLSLDSSNAKPLETKVPESLLTFLLVSGLTCDRKANFKSIEFLTN